MAERDEANEESSGKGSAKGFSHLGGGCREGGQWEEGPEEEEREERRYRRKTGNGRSWEGEGPLTKVERGERMY